MRRLGWNEPDVSLSTLHIEPRQLSSALWMAREVGDTTTEDRVRAVAQTRFQPRYFGEENDRFAFWFGYDSTWPRGQVNATTMLIEAGSPGAWWRVFNEPAPTLASQPTLRGVDYPSIGIRLARSDMAQRVLTIHTTAATPSRRGDPTCFTIDQLPSPAEVTVIVDGQDAAGWRVTGPDSIQLNVDIGDHQIRVAFPGGDGPR
jgi:hypothetical protein